MKAIKYNDIAILESTEGKFTKSKHHVVAQKQRGSTCGLYSLSIAGNAITKKYVPATSGDIGKNQEFSLRKAARKTGVTQVGELFDAQQIVELAPLLGLAAQVIKVDASSFYNEIKKAIDADALVMVPYSVDASHRDTNWGPGEIGNNPHWVLAFGYNAKDILITSWGYYYSYDAKVFQKSNACVKDWPDSYYGRKAGSTIKDYAQVVPGTAPKERHIGMTKLSDTLASKIVVISYKAGSTLLKGGIRIKVSSNDTDDSLQLDYQLRSTIANFQKSGKLDKNGVAELKWYMPENIEIRFPGHSSSWSKISLNTNFMLPNGRYSYELREIVL
jgi:hypothetical protein